jgi:Tat protein translocase TatB subunit
MFNIGGGELIVILLIALIVLGPQRLPNAARQLGKAMSDLRRLSTGFQTEMKQALETADDPTRVAARRHVLASEPVPVADEAVAAAVADDTAADAASESIAAVTAQPSAPVSEDPEPRTTT